MYKYAIFKFDQFRLGTFTETKKLVEKLKMPLTSKRIESFYISRMALHTLIPEIEYAKLEIENYRNLAGIDGVCGLSHSNQYGAAIYSEVYAGVGIDIELKDRPMKDNADKYYINNRDDRPSSTEFWCIKEASFKALSPICPELKLLKDIVIQNDEFSFQNKKGKFEILPHNDLIIVCAFIN